MLVDDGVLGGTRLLSPASVQTLTENHTGDFFAQFFPGMGFGFSVEVKLEPSGEGSVVPSGASPGAFAWAGAAYTGFWVDPDERLIGIFMTQRRGGDDVLRKAFGRIVYDALLAARPAGAEIR